MSKKIGKYKIGKHEHPKYTDSTIDILGDVTFSSASLQTIDGGSLTTTGILSAIALASLFDLPVPIYSPAPNKFLSIALPNGPSNNETNGLLPYL